MGNFGRCTLLPFLVALHLSTGHLPAAQTDRPTGDEGSIEGVVSYRADARRSWRYARFYVKDRRKGFLAEAVVELRGKGLDSTPARPAETVTMDQKNFQFIPETLAIRSGDAVKFTSRDAETHNVRTSGSLASFSENMPRGGEYVHTFDRAGGIRRPIKISCVYHGAMRAWIFAFNHPYYQVTGNDGRFKLERVPAGEYVLEMSHPAGQLRWRRSIQLESGQRLRIDIPVSPDYKIGSGR